MVVQIIGFSGMSLILFAFIMNQIQKWKDDDMIYDGFNAIGGLLMINYAFLIKSYPFFILNLIWAIVSIKDVLMGFRK